MIYDCFTFYNELELLELRLNILNDVIDKFVIVESRKTFTGKDKPLYFEENQERFSKFKDKIIHVISDEYQNAPTAWYQECTQRNSISKGLENCDDNDIIIISDVDEIPNPKKILPYKDIEGIKLFEITTHNYYINCINEGFGIWLLGPKMLSYKDFKTILNEAPTEYGEHLVEELNQGTTPSKIRYFKDTYHINNGGWHFSFLGGAQMVLQKLNAFSHQEYGNEYRDLESLEKKIASGKDLFARKGFSCQVEPLNATYPEYIIKNKETYSHLICKLAPTAYAKYYAKKVIKRLFSLKNEYSGKQKRKVLTIFGIKFKFKKNKYKNKKEN